APVKRRQSTCGSKRSASLMPGARCPGVMKDVADPTDPASTCCRQPSSAMRSSSRPRPRRTVGTPVLIVHMISTLSYYSFSCQFRPVRTIECDVRQSVFSLPERGQMCRHRATYGGAKKSQKIPGRNDVGFPRPGISWQLWIKWRGGSHESTFLL